VSGRNTTAPYWSVAAGDLTASLGSGPNGLATARAAERLVVVGPNSVEDAPRLGPHSALAAWQLSRDAPSGSSG
jgi:hypothetical protein